MRSFTIRFRWTGHKAGLGDTKTAYKILVSNVKGDHSGKTDESKIQILDKYNMDWIELARDMVECRAFVNSRSINAGNFLICGYHMNQI
jgi:hypothetical protein